VSSFPQRIEFSISAVRGILDAVINRLPNWSIELEQQGILGENMSFKDEEKALAQNTTFDIEHVTGFIGDVSNSKVEVYDYSSIHKTLKDAGVPKTERDDLEQFMDDLKVAPPEEKPRPCSL
jgi:AbiTii